MSLALLRSRGLIGLTAPPVRVEVHLATGLPSFSLVGLADTEVKEARERVRAALAHSGFEFPHNRRVTVSLAPADLPKDSGRFDLPIALGILAAQGLLDPAALQAAEFAGELSLAGELRPVRGALALAMALRECAEGGEARALVLPADSASDAASVPGLDVRGPGSLAEVVRAFQPGGGGVRALPEARPRTSAAAPPWPDLADVRGQPAARRALEIAAAGAHALLMIGPPGAGKSMLALRLAGLLPPMSDAEALASAAVMGLARGQPAGVPFGRRPVRAPHHTASAVALVGGGVPPAPGEISLAHGGVLFLDELPEFGRAALEALREPLETGHVTISRAGAQARYPARFQLVAAMNPCPCGWADSAAPSGPACRCGPEGVRRYQARLSGPLLDRIDLQIDLPPLEPAVLLPPAGAPSPEETSAQVAARVRAARERALARQGVPNAWLGADRLDDAIRLTPPARALLVQVAERWRWSGRRLHRVARVARTVADLDRQAEVQAAHVAEAVQLRRSGVGA